MKNRIQFVEPGLNWNAKVWQNAFVRYAVAYKKTDESSCGCFLSFLETCRGAFQKNGQTKTATQLSQIRETIIALGKGEKIKFADGVELADGFMTRFDGLKDDDVLNLSKLIHEKVNELNSCSVQQGRWRMRMDVVPAHSPCDYCEIKDVAFFKGSWFLVGKKLWKSDDAITWKEIELDRFDKCWYESFRFSVSDDHLVVWSVSVSEYSFSDDGMTWEYGKLPEFSNSSWPTNFFYQSGKWYVQINLFEFYLFKKKIGFIKLPFDDGVSYTLTRFCLTRDLHSQWEVIDAVTSEDVEYFEKRALSVFGDTVVGIVSPNDLYAKQIGASVRNARFVYMEGNRFDAKCDRELVANIFGQVKSCFKEYVGALYCACDHNGLFVSRDHGKSWELVWASKDYKFRFYEIGGILLLRGEFGLYCFDGSTCNKFSGPQKYDIAAFDGKKVLFADKRAKGGGLFLGELRMEDDG